MWQYTIIIVAVTFTNSSLLLEAALTWLKASEGQRWVKKWRWPAWWLADPLWMCCRVWLTIVCVCCRVWLTTGCVCCKVWLTIDCVCVAGCRAPIQQRGVQEGQRRHHQESRRAVWGGGRFWLSRAVVALNVSPLDCWSRSRPVLNLKKIMPRGSVLLLWFMMSFSVSWSYWCWLISLTRRFLGTQEAISSSSSQTALKAACFGVSFSGLVMMKARPDVDEGAKIMFLANTNSAAIAHSSFLLGHLNAGCPWIWNAAFYINVMTASWGETAAVTSPTKKSSKE